MKAIGVLALQGDFGEHVSLLDNNNVRAVEVRSKKNLDNCSALIIPGGESTTIIRLMRSAGLGGEIKKRVLHGMPLYGTCAGAIVAAKRVVGETRFKPLGLIDIDVERNAFGRQADSFEAEVLAGNGKKLTGIFIRSPRIVRVGKGVEVLAEQNKEPVLVKQRNVIAGTFHPELAGESSVHSMLLKLI